MRSTLGTLQRKKVNAGRNCRRLWSSPHGHCSAAKGRTVPLYSTMMQVSISGWTPSIRIMNRRSSSTCSFTINQQQWASVGLQFHPGESCCVSGKEISLSQGWIYCPVRQSLPISPSLILAPGLCKRRPYVHGATHRQNGPLSL